MRSSDALAAELGRKVAELCPSCDGALSPIPDGFRCPTCARDFKASDPPRCMLCGDPLTAAGNCMRCDP